MLDDDQMEALKGLRLFVDHVAQLPSAVKLTPITHYDMCTILEQIIFILTPQENKPNDEHATNK